MLRIRPLLVYANRCLHLWREQGAESMSGLGFYLSISTVSQEVLREEQHAHSEHTNDQATEHGLKDKMNVRLGPMIGRVCESNRLNGDTNASLGARRWVRMEGRPMGESGKGSPHWVWPE